MKLNISIIILVLLFFSCKKDNIKSSEDKEAYKILSVLFNKICREEMNFYAFPAPPPTPNISWDSIKKIMEEDKKIEKDTLKIVNTLLKKNGRLIVAIDSVLKPNWADNIKNIKYQGYEKLLEQFISNKDSLSIDVSRISSNKYAFIIPYRENYKYLPRKGYEKFNISLSFSNIKFNKQNTKAIVIMGAGFGKLNGYSAIFFLEKEKEKWLIKWEKGLSIS
jgi:PBP1b-binding outer membrane lipoprotein LpoB